MLSVVKRRRPKGPVDDSQAPKVGPGTWGVPQRSGKRRDSACASANTHTHARAHTHAHTHTHSHTHTHTRVHAHTHARACARHLIRIGDMAPLLHHEPAQALSYVRTSAREHSTRVH